MQDFDFPSKPTIAVGDIDQRTFLVAFLVLWLCYFIAPYKYLSRIESAVFIIADKLAQGAQVSLVPVVLSNLFRSLKGAYTADFPGAKDTMIPLHYLLGWFNLRFKGCTMLLFLRA